jgi:succinate dehydrogenase/fumarate reductase flavoprotein subunit
MASPEQIKQLCARWLAPMERTSDANPFEIREQLEKVMWRKVGVVRNGDDMRAAVPEIQEIKHRAQASSAGGAGSTIYNAKWNEAINVENLATIGEMITRSALAREESRGAHYRTDFPKQDATWFKNIRMQPANGDLKIFSTPVKFTRLTPPELKEKQTVEV